MGEKKRGVVPHLRKFINAEVLARTRGLLRFPLSTYSLLTDFWGDESCITLTRCSRDTNCTYKSGWQLINHHAQAALLRQKNNSVGKSQAWNWAQGEGGRRFFSCLPPFLSSIMQAVTTERSAIQMDYWFARFFHLERESEGCTNAAPVFYIIPVWVCVLVGGGLPVFLLCVNKMTKEGICFF